MKHTCIVCGSTFDKPDFRLRKFCSDKCANRFHNLKSKQKAEPIDYIPRNLAPDLYENPEPCLVCGSKKTYYCRHWKQGTFDVLWLCRKCFQSKSKTSR